jgi:hypothetical protein
MTIYLSIYLSINLPIYLYLAAAHGSQVRIRAAFWWPLQFSGTEKGLTFGGYNPLPSGNSMEVYVKWPNLTVCYGNLWAMDENGPWFHHLASISFYRW